MQSMTPLRRPSTSAWRSSSLRSGGFILRRGSRPRTSSSVIVRWCGLASHVTATPRALAAAMTATDSRAERCWMWIRACSYSASAQSRAIIVDSLTLGIPATPSSALTTPSCIAPVPDSAGSSSCSASTPPHSRWYCSARRKTPASATGLPSSVKPAAPSARSSAISVSSRPARPRVIAGMKPTGTRASRAAASSSAPRIGPLSTTGAVFGIATTAQ